MRNRLHLAAILLLTGAATTHAQITNPDTLIGKPPQAPTHHATTTSTDDLQWLWQFTKPAPVGRATDLRLDERFQSLLAREFKQPQAMWGEGHTHLILSMVIPLFLSAHGDVESDAGRYLTIDGCVPSFCPAHGLLWIDMQASQPTMVFAAVNWTAQGHSTAEPNADYNLWLFANRQLSPDTLPFALTTALSRWDARLAAAHRAVPHIANAILIEPDGTPHTLDPKATGANTLPPQPDTTSP
jgi:hypothetical protein